MKQYKMGYSKGEKKPHKFNDQIRKLFSPANLELSNEF
jgi:hypothetical protein